ncbi:zf-HC2 domain-containing protein [bacterium]|nr:zf-HC2 domain-containing protein [bacterium]
MKCNNPQIRELVSRYQMNLLTDSAERSRVEAHILSCEHCFQESCSMSPALDLLNEHPQCFLDAAIKPEPFFKKNPAGVRVVIKNIFDRLTMFFDFILDLWTKPPVRILVPVGASIALALVLLLPRPATYTDLAVIKKADYQPVSFRGVAPASESARIFEDAMKAYVRDDYRESIEKLNAYCAMEPDNAYGRFYLGVSHVMNEELDEGTGHLETALILCRGTDNPVLLNECLWMLGNVSLRLEQPEKAIEYLKENHEIEGADQKRIDQLIDAIEKLMNKGQ